MVCEKTNATSRSRLDSESVMSVEEDFSFLCVQNLLNKNRTVFLNDPMGLIVESFGINRKCFCDSIYSRKSDDGCGWLSTLHRRVFKGIALEQPFRQVHQVEESRQPTFNVIDNRSCAISYQTRDGSVMALLLHLLFNVRVAYKNHWAMKFLKQTKEFILLVPGNVGVVFRVDEKIDMQQFSASSVEVKRPIRIGHFMG